jgi:SAM-dependent methyltransferase
LSEDPTKWWQTFFRDIVVDMWLQAVPETHTRAEVDFITTMLRIAPPAAILDGPCGGGRHAIPLASAGYRMTGVDVSPDFLAAAKRIADPQQLSVRWIESSMAKIPFVNEFDGALCFGNSFGYDDDEGNRAFLAAIFRSLKPGARLVLDYPTVLECRAPRFQARNWAQTGDVYFLEDEYYNPATGRIDTEYTFLRNGQVARRKATHRTYTFRQIAEMLSDIGFRDLEAYGTLTGEPFRLGSECCFLIVTKPTE